MGRGVKLITRHSNSKLTICTVSVEKEIYSSVHILVFYTILLVVAVENFRTVTICYARPSLMST